MIEVRRRFSCDLGLSLVDVTLEPAAELPVPTPAPVTVPAAPAPPPVVGFSLLGLQEAFIRVAELPAAWLRSAGMTEIVMLHLAMS